MRQKRPTEGEGRVVPDSLCALAELVRQLDGLPASPAGAGADVGEEPAKGVEIGCLHDVILLTGPAAGSKLRVAARGRASGGTSGAYTGLTQGAEEARGGNNRWRDAQGVSAGGNL